MVVHGQNDAEPACDDEFRNQERHISGPTGCYNITLQKDKLKEIALSEFYIIARALFLAAHGYLYFDSKTHSLWRGSFQLNHHRRDL